MKWIRVGALLVWLAAILTWLIPGESGRLRVWFLDVGEGDATLVATPGGAVILIDAGPPHGGDVVRKALDANGLRRVDLFVWTHPQSDHIGGAAKVMEAVPVSIVLEPQLEYKSETYAEDLRIARERQVRWVKARRGQLVDFGDGVTAEVLHPAGEPVEDVNEASVVIRLRYGQRTFVFQGDAGYLAEARMVAHVPMKEADVLKVGHHGSRSASSEPWLNAIKPKFAVISCGRGNRYGHPHGETMEKLRRLGSTVYRTDEDGTIECATDGRSLDFRLASAR